MEQITLVVLEQVRWSSHVNVLFTLHGVPTQAWTVADNCLSEFG